VSPVELVVLAVSQSRRRVARGLHSTRYTILFVPVADRRRRRTTRDTRRV